MSWSKQDNQFFKINSTNFKISIGGPLIEKCTEIFQIASVLK